MKIVSSAPLKLCLVSPLPPPRGGIGRWTEMIRDYAKWDGRCRIHIVDTSPRWRAIDDLRIWRRVVFGGLTMIGHVFKVLACLLSDCRVIHIAAPGQLSVFRDLVIICLGRLFRVRTIYHVRFGRVPQIAVANTPEWRRIAKAMKLAWRVIAIDHATEQAIRRHLPEAKVILLPNCVDLANMPVPVAGDMPQTVLFVGWMIPDKGVRELVQAWGQLDTSGWRLVMIGPGDADFRQQLRRQYQGDNVELHGETPHAQVMNKMARCEIFTLPSYTEGFPNVVVEAMALGKPIVATTVGAIPQMLEGDAGVLIPPRDVQSLVTALRQLMNDPAARQDMAAKAQARVREHYSLSAVYDRLVELWQTAARGDN